MNIGQKLLVENTILEDDYDIADILDSVSDMIESFSEVDQLERLSHNLQEIKNAVENTTSLESLTTLLKDSFTGKVDFSSKESILIGIESVKSDSEKLMLDKTRMLITSTAMYIKTRVAMLTKIAIAAKKSIYDSNGKAKREVSSELFDLSELTDQFSNDIIKYIREVELLIWKGVDSITDTVFGEYTEVAKTASVASKLNSKLKDKKSYMLDIAEKSDITNTLHKFDKELDTSIVMLEKLRTKFNHVPAFRLNEIPDLPANESSFIAYARDWRLIHLIELRYLEKAIFARYKLLKKIT